jgi:hypothetical protein
LVDGIIDIGKGLVLEVRDKIRMELIKSKSPYRH